MSQPKYIFLDSTWLREASPVSKDARQLAEAAAVGIVVPVTCDLVLHEVATGLAQKAAVPQKIVKPVADLDRWLSATSPMVQEAKKFVSAAKVMNDSYKTLSRELHSKLESWFRALPGKVVSIDDIEPWSVFEDYFNGQGVFDGAVKSRQNLPDAFIFAAIAQLATAEGGVLLVTRDKRLRSAAERIDSVSTAESLATAPTFQSMLKALAAATTTDYLASHTLSAEADVHADGTAGIWVNEPYGDQDALIDELATQLRGQTLELTVLNEGEVTISSIDATDFHVDWPSELPPARDHTQAPFRAELAATVDAFVPKYEYWSDAEDGRLGLVLIDGDWNKHYVWAQMSLQIVVEGEIDLGVEYMEDESAYRGISFTIGYFQIADAEIDGRSVLSPEQYPYK